MNLIKNDTNFLLVTHVIHVGGINQINTLMTVSFHLIDV